jgi:peptidoglycan/LPS O-acetylase OafA/YrhL
MTVDLATREQAITRTRSGLLDGVRGVAIVLVVMSHLWVVYPVVNWHSRAVQIVFGSGDFAVNIFFVVGAFLATSGMLREVDRTGNLRFGVVVVRRWLRISAHVYPLVIVVLALTAAGAGIKLYSTVNTRQSAWHIVTYTWNGYVAAHPLEARPDLGHLWYVCTDLWSIVLISSIVYVLRLHRRLLLAALLAVAGVLAVYRWHVYVHDGYFAALIKLQARADAPVWGAIAAVALPFAGGLRRWAPAIGAFCALALVPIMFWVHSLSRYFSVPGLILDVVLALFVVSVTLAPPHVTLARTIGTRPWRFLGRHSLGLYLWHYPIFWYLGVNYPHWQSWAKVALGLGATVVVATLMTFLVERPLQRWLRSPGWQQVSDEGLAQGAWRVTRAKVSREWHAARSGHGPGPDAGP